MMTGDEAVHTYVAQRVALGDFSSATARNTSCLLAAWLRWVADWRSPTADEIIGWITIPLSRDGKHRRESCLRRFYRWAFDHRRLTSDVAPMVPSIRGSEKRPKPIPDPVLARALGRASQRDHDAIVLGRFAGLRSMEIAAVHRDHLAGGMLWVRGKGERERFVPAHPMVASAVTSSRGWVFPNRLGGHVNAGTMSKWLGKALPEPWTAHTLRHAFGSDLYAQTKDLVLVAELMGHSSTRTTERYIQVRHGAGIDAVRAMRLAA
jgi:integrase/recombinase XerC